MDQLVVVGSNITFMCSAMGVPRPNIAWFALSDMGPVELTTAMFSIEVTDGPGERNVTSTVTLTNVQPFMALTYSCNATNVVSATESTAVLTVHSELHSIIPQC